MLFGSNVWRRIVGVDRHVVIEDVEIEGEDDLAVVVVDVRLSRGARAWATQIELCRRVRSLSARVRVRRGRHQDRPALGRPPPRRDGRCISTVLLVALSAPISTDGDRALFDAPGHLRGRKAPLVSLCRLVTG